MGGTLKTHPYSMAAFFFCERHGKNLDLWKNKGHESAKPAEGDRFCGGRATHRWLENEWFFMAFCQAQKEQTKGEGFGKDRRLILVGKSKRQTTSFRHAHVGVLSELFTRCLIPCWSTETSPKCSDSFHSLSSGTHRCRGGVGRLHEADLPKTFKRSNCHLSSLHGHT